MRTFKLLVGATFTLVSLMPSQGPAAEPGGDYPAAATQDAATDDATMAQWKRRDEARDWIAEELAKHQVVIPADNKGLVGKGQGSTYGSVTPEDVKVVATRDVQIGRGRLAHLSQRRSTREHDRRLLRYVPSRRIEHPPRDLSEISGPARAGRAAARHDQLVHRESGAREAACAGFPRDARVGDLHLCPAQGRASGVRKALGTATLFFNLAPR